jgi:hypothetical protein
MDNTDLAQDAKSLLGHVAHAIYEAIRELELGANHIDATAAELSGVDDLPEEDEQLARALGELGRDLFRHVRALRHEMDALFEDETDEPSRA